MSQGRPPTKENTLILILGASEFPKFKQLTSSGSFRESAKAFRNYVISDDGLGVTESSVLDLFDAPETLPQLDEKIIEFLKQQIASRRAQENEVRDLILYYVGHGGFSSKDQNYYLALRDSRQDNDYVTSYGAAVLANTLRRYAKSIRKFIILDSCFAASAYSDFQNTGPLQVARRQMEHEIADKGTALLCASGPRSPAKAPIDMKYTMFSDALLKVLHTGVSDTSKKAISLGELGELIVSHLVSLHTDDAVRPQVLYPDQAEGDLSRLPLFPNAAIRFAPAVRIQFLENENAQLQQQIMELRSRVISISATEASKHIDQDETQWLFSRLSWGTISVLFPQLCVFTLVYFWFFAIFFDTFSYRSNIYCVGLFVVSIFEFVLLMRSYFADYVQAPPSIRLALRSHLLTVVLGIRKEIDNQRSSLFGYAWIVRSTRAFLLMIFLVHIIAAYLLRPI